MAKPKKAPRKKEPLRYPFGLLTVMDLIGGTRERRKGKEARRG